MITLTEILTKHQVTLTRREKSFVGRAVKARSRELGHLPMFVKERTYTVNGYPDEFENEMVGIIMTFEMPKKEVVKPVPKPTEKAYVKVEIGKKKRPRIKK